MKTHIHDDDFVFEFDNIEVGDMIISLLYDDCYKCVIPRTGFVIDKTLFDEIMLTFDEEHPLNDIVPGFITVRYLNNDGTFNKIEQKILCWNLENE